MKKLVLSITLLTAVPLFSAGAGVGAGVSSAAATNFPEGTTEIALVLAANENPEEFLNNLVSFIQTSAALRFIEAEAYTAADITKLFDAKERSAEAQRFFEVLSQLLKLNGLNDHEIANLYERAKYYSLRRLDLFNLIEQLPEHASPETIAEIHKQIAQLEQEWRQEAYVLQDVYHALFDDAKAAGLLSEHTILQQFGDEDYEDEDEGYVGGEELEEEKALGG